MTVHLSTGARNASTAAVVARIDANGAGSIKIYSGTQPATGDTAAAGTLLATVALAVPSFGTATSGTATGADPAAVTAVASGTAAWFRVADGSGNGVFDGSVTGTGGGGDMTLSSTALSAGISVDLTSFTYSTPA
jgi:hypothetical protein